MEGYDYQTLSVVICVAKRQLEVLGRASMLPKDTKHCGNMHEYAEEEEDKNRFPISVCSGRRTESDIEFAYVREQRELKVVEGALMLWKGMQIRHVAVYVG